MDRHVGIYERKEYWLGADNLDERTRDLRTTPANRRPPRIRAPAPRGRSVHWARSRHAGQACGTFATAVLRGALDHFPPRRRWQFVLSGRERIGERVRTRQYRHDRNAGESAACGLALRRDGFA